ncbi:MAG: SCO family protein [Gammaproteobacteria bacterium]|nr:SCO family protein [Gammaproteobacteria bacterium]
MLRISAVGLLLLTLFGFVGVHASDETISQNKDQVLELGQAPPGGGFTLQSSKGPVSLEDFRGKLVLLYFGYTRCPDICPTSLSLMVQALNGLGEAELERVQPIFISVDPIHDTPESLAEYAEFFHPNMVGLTGSEKAVADTAALYGAKYYEVVLKGAAFGYSVNHSSTIYLITPDGKLRFIFPHATPSSVMLEAIKYVLAGN